MSTSRLPTVEERIKREELLKLLDEGCVANVWLLCDAEGVSVPIEARSQDARWIAHIHLSRSFVCETFEINPLGIEVDLSFGRERKLCVIPFCAIIKISDYDDEIEIVWPPTNEFMEIVSNRFRAWLNFIKIEAESKEAEMGNLKIIK